MDEGWATISLPLPPSLCSVYCGCVLWNMKACKAELVSCEGPPHWSVWQSAVSDYYYVRRHLTAYMIFLKL